MSIEDVRKALKNLKDMTLTKTEKDQVQRLEERLDAIEDKLARIQNIVIGIAIGIAVGGVIFGVISIKEFVNAVK